VRNRGFGTLHVLLLRDVFGFGYDEVAGVVGKTEGNCRQIAARARRHVMRYSRPATPSTRRPATSR
jgi:RNA polymerase sigma-70 factor (ECF subfamily)